MQHTIDTPKYINNNLISLPHSINTPKYLKKVVTETAWTQPILSANGTLGGNSFAVGINVTQHYINIWTCFNGQTDAGYITPDNGIYTPAAVEITIYNPIPLNIKKFTLSQGSTNASGGLHAGTIYGSNDGANWVKIGTYSGLTAQSSTITEYINLPNNNTYYKYHKISNTEGGYNGVVVKEITLTATQKVETWTAGTLSDYDVIVPQVHSINTPKYLKKTTKQTVLNQPILSSNGTLGGNTFAVTGTSMSEYDYWKAFTFTNYNAMVSGGGGLPYWQASWNTMAEYTMYNPNPIKGTITFYSQCYTTCKIQGSNDGVNFKDVTSTLSRGSQVVGFYTFTATITAAYKYLKIVPLTTYAANETGYILRIKWVDLTQMVEQTEAWTAGTSNDYDLIK